MGNRQPMAGTDQLISGMEIMKNLMALCGALTTMAAAAHGGGIDRSGQPIGILFEEGNYVELSYGVIRPSVSGKDLAIYGGNASGEVAGDHTLPGFALKYQFSDRLSGAVIYDHAYGADIDYTSFTGFGATGSYMLGDTLAKVDSEGLTGLLRYKFSENFSMHGGLRVSKASGQVALGGQAYGPTFDPANPATYATVNGYSADLASSWGTGYVIGAAYEKPEIALRVALTYFSKISHDFDTVETLPSGTTLDANTPVDTPQAVNLDFQTGIMKDTLLFGSVRWVDWSEFKIAPDQFFGPNVGSLTNLDDTVTYTLGLGRKFSDTWSGSIFATWEPGTGDLVSPLAPTDGYKGIGVAAVYRKDNMKITTGLRYLWLGDAKPETGTPDVARADFSGNTAVALGVKVGFTF